MAIKIALAGNPNCGKTTLFNALTGSNQFVGNWPGVTVEKKEGRLKNRKDVTVIDLPGIYSLSPYTLEEVVARNYLINERPDAIINIVDGTNIERNLYLSTQIMELGIPVVLAVNMSDLIEKSGDKIHKDKLSSKLGCEVVEISALKGTGIQKAADKAVELALAKKVSAPVHEFAKDVEDVITAVEDKLGNDVSEEQKRFFAIKLLEKDDKISGFMKSAPNVEAEIAALEEAFDDDTESIITNERYVYISSVIGDCVTKSGRKKLSVSDKIDRIVTNRIAALPIFAVIMFLVYFISVTTVGTWVTDWTNDGLFGDGFHIFGIGTAEYEDDMTEYYKNNIWTEELIAQVDAAADAGVIGAEDFQGAIEDEDFGAFEEAYDSYADSLAEEGFDISEIVDGALEAEDCPDTSTYKGWVPGVPVLVERGLDAINCVEWLKSLILDGIVAGVGAVLGFVPQMLVLFILLAILESCGYMARVAFIMDRIFRRFGLSGKSFIPMLIGSGCGVPGIMASRTIENDRDRKMTIMTTTFIPCGAKMPIIALIAAALFGNAWWIAPVAYFIGVAAVVISGIILKKTKAFAGDPAPFVMELPAYHVPTFGNVIRSMWERGWSFIKKAGTIILLSSIVIWAGSVFGTENGKMVFNPDIELEASILGHIGNAIKVIFAPLGFGNIKATVATIMGLVAKEEVVGVFGVLDFEGLTKLSAFAFMIFNLLCAPCFAAMGAIKREMNSAKWFWIAVGYQTGLAYLVSLVVFQLGSLFSGNGNVIGVIISLIIVALFLYLLFRPYRESKVLKVDSKKLAGASK
ncbi:MAG: ferrous iron transporter B [Butyrivibrio sp.]|nr:ferrous iron transporter B [Butyrivibrio sp.]